MLGDSDGRDEGAIDTVGLPEGGPEGTSLGVSDGILVGMLVGRSLGERDGRDVSVGTVEGE